MWPCVCEREMAGVFVLILSFYCSFSRSTQPVKSLKRRQFNIFSTNYLANIVMEDHIKLVTMNE